MENAAVGEISFLEGPQWEDMNRGEKGERGVHRSFMDTRRCNQSHGFSFVLSRFELFQPFFDMIIMIIREDRRERRKERKK